jgi:pyrimidine deaminase RibD-like protein
VPESIVDWKAITPKVLVVPVEHVRKTFSLGVWKCSEVTKKLCFADLHPDERQVDLEAYRSAFLTYRNIIGIQAARQFDNDHRAGTPAAIFHAYLEAFSAGLDANIRESFDDLLQIGIAHSARLATPPVEWAKTHLSVLIDDDRHMVMLWIKSVCDRQDYSRPLNTDQETDDFIHWRYWRAPRLILMQPSGSVPFNTSTAWDREDESTTEKWLEGLSGRFIRFLGFHLEKIAGDAHVELAKTVSRASDDDRPFQLMAIEEARKSVAEDGRPHPKVGAVVVKNGEVLSRAFRGEVPKSHAEYIALEQKLSDDLAAGATVYTTLEPCTTRNHPKIPCARRLVERKIARVVIGMLDPNPDIRGLGEQLLNEAGIETQLFPRELRAQVEEINREFIRVQKEKQNAI